jgi:hypothetical protein
MARALRIQFPGAFYHITCRGIERRHIFLDDKDRNRFLFLLSNSLKAYQVVLYAYILMNNHFHLLIQTKKANCSEFMRHLGNILGGIDYGAVYLLRRRLREKMAENEAVSEKYKEIETRVMNACSM